ncbi:MAG: PKD domain-containing protein, partial [Cellulomonadaceae bacterium]|nr:PKD domain-containing protein [Cellulomonadaceae bacterium]
DTATGALITSFRPTLGSTGRAVTATNDTVYIGGDFSAVASQTGGTLVDHGYLAAFDAATGAVQPFVADADAPVAALAVTADGGKLVVGGRFTTINAAAAYGLGAVNPSTGAVVSFPASTYIRNAGTASGITALYADATGVYGAGYHFGGGGNLEGSFRADASTGELIWVADCHGDTYSVYPQGDVVYSVGHAHYCGNIPDGFPQTASWTYHHISAFTMEAQSTSTPDIYGYGDHPGQPAPGWLYIWPQFVVGDYTGQGQAGWSITGNSDYVVMGGEFIAANGAAQQGLVRFAKKSTAPNQQGPRVSGASFNPRVTSTVSGTVQVSWAPNWDRDNETLTYRLYRGTESTLVHERTVTQRTWVRNTMGFTDTGLTPGSSQQYLLTATDPFGNVASSQWVTVTVASSGTASAYVAAVRADEPVSLWRLDETSGTSSLDLVGADNLTTGTGVSRGTAGAVGDGDTASTFSGNSNGTARNAVASNAPDDFTVEAWVRTTSSQGGKVVGFGSAATGTSGTADRHLYLDNSGRVFFGVQGASLQTVNSSSTYRDGQWHQLVGTYTNGVMSLYVDGKRVGQRTDVTYERSYWGYWRVGGDRLNSWPSRPTSDNLSGSIDDVAVYWKALTQEQVVAHYTASGRTVATAPVPADAYGSAVRAASPDLYWRLGESSGTAAADSGANGLAATYRTGYTLNAAGALSGVSDTATSFNGTSGLVSSNQSFTGPATYSEELWFKTTTTAGGKLIGFGSSQTGLSATVDRHVYMGTDGKLTFGVNSGGQVKVTSAAAYNDGQWHHVVATQALNGARLYVDGALVGQNAATGSLAYTGYWRVGGDTSWAGASYFNGTIDEVAVYSTALAASTVAAHYSLGATGTVADQAPTAAFTSASSGTRTSFDASGSSDPDGTVAAYAWDFGDGQTGAGVTAQHTYAAAGTYTVTLTVTDDRGATGATSRSVTVVTGLASDGFARTVSSGWGTADLGGLWTVSGAATSYTVGNGLGSQKLTAAGATRSAALGSVSSTDTEVMVATSLDKVQTGGGSTVTVTGRRVGALEYAARLKFVSTGVVTVSAMQSATALASANLAGTYAPGDQLQVRLQVVGTSPTTVRAKVWKVGSAEPAAWTVSTTDSTATLQAPGQVALGSYLTSSATNAPMTATFDNLLVYPTTAPPPNQLPTASFVSSASFLVASVDGTASGDLDGTIASYAWAFGDGQTGTGATATHTYAAAGTYPVTLTVTDDDGGTGTVTHDVTVVAPPVNQLPTASFTQSASGLVASVDGSGSSDSDGTIASYAWAFGDGQTATGATATHAYAAAGTYSVTLTVTDNSGGTGSTTKAVTVAAPVILAADAFGRTSASGWGTADAGGLWTVAGTATNYTVGSGVGSQTMTAAGSTRTAYLSSVASTDTEVMVSAALNKAQTGGGSTATVVGRRVGTSEYAVRMKFLATGVVTVSAMQTGTALVSVNLAGTYTPGDQLQVRLQVVGTSPTTVRAKVWRLGTAEPTAWTVSATDSTATLQTAGGVGLASYLTSTATNAPMTATFDNLQAYPSTAPPSSNLAPVAAFTSGTSGLTASFDGAGSSDPDGTVTSYAWAFGDGQTGSGVTAQHTYAAAGTYPVTLTVTDNGLKTATSTGSVTVTDPPPNQLPTATFTPSTAGPVVSVDGTASTDPDGTIASYAWAFGDGGTATGATAQHTYAAGGTFTVTLTVTDDDGGTALTSQDVTVVAPPVNQAPTAAFAVTANGLVASVDGSGSSDSDGSIASYAWAFGDTGTATGATAQHTYAAAGTYTVTLTVTDDDGATGIVSHDVTVVAAPVTELARDLFTREVTGGWGSADVGGAWTVLGTATSYQVTGGVGVQRLTTAGATRSTFLNAVSATSVSIQGTVSLDKAQTGGGTYVTVVGRRVGSVDLGLRMKFLATGAVTVQAMSGSTALASVTMATPYTAGDRLQVRVEVTGTAPTTVRAKVWPVGTPEPAAWQVTGTDATATLQVAGTVGLVSYLSGSATNAPVAVSFDDLVVTPLP